MSCATTSTLPPSVRSSKNATFSSDISCNRIGCIVMQNSSGPIGSPCWVPSSDRMIFFTCLRIGLQEYEACTKEESYYYYSYSYYYYCYYYPCSPLMFNLCFNTLMKTLSKPEFKSLGYIWGPPSKTTTCSWLQFADN